MIKLFPFIIKRFLLACLILLSFTTSVNAANFVVFKNSNSGVSALAPNNWIMDKQVSKMFNINTLLRIISPDAKMHLEVTVNTDYLPVSTYAELSQGQIDGLTTEMINSHLAMFRGSKLTYFNKNARYYSLPSIIYIFKMNQDNEDFTYYIHSFIYNHYLYSIKFINRSPGDLSPEELVSIVNSVRFSWSYLLG